jgi:prefoldin subunit 5
VSKNNLYLISSKIFRARVAALEKQIDGLRGDIARLDRNIARLDRNISDIRNYNIQMLLIKKNLFPRAGG